MTKLWRHGAFNADIFATLDDAAALPVAVPVIVTLKRWRAERDALLAHDAPVGVIVEPTADLAPATDALGKLAVIVIPFAKFTDGRGYSLARRLRDEFGYRAELRASGDVLVDQIPLMQRCGFDAFSIANAPTLRALSAGHLPAIPEVYQTASYGRTRTTAAFTSRPIATKKVA